MDNFVQPSLTQKLTTGSLRAWLLRRVNDQIAGIDAEGVRDSLERCEVYPDPRLCLTDCGLPNAGSIRQVALRPLPRLPQLFDAQTNWCHALMIPFSVSACNSLFQPTSAAVRGRALAI